MQVSPSSPRKGPKLVHRSTSEVSTLIQMFHRPPDDSGKGVIISRGVTDFPLPRSRDVNCQPSARSSKLPITILDCRKLTTTFLHFSSGNFASGCRIAMGSNNTGLFKLETRHRVSNTQESANRRHTQCSPTPSACLCLGS
jgi:hypothetical protein